MSERRLTPSSAQRRLLEEVERNPRVWTLAFLFFRLGLTRQQQMDLPAVIPPDEPTT